MQRLSLQGFQHLGVCWVPLPFGDAAFAQLIVAFTPSRRVARCATAVLDEFVGQVQTTQFLFFCNAC